MSLTESNVKSLMENLTMLKLIIQYIMSSKYLSQTLLYAFKCFSDTGGYLHLILKKVNLHCMDNIMPVIHRLVGPALKYVCHIFHKNKHEVLEVIIQNQQASRNHMNTLNAVLGMRLQVKNSAYQF
jgi:hypothetical protein